MQHRNRAVWIWKGVQLRSGLVCMSHRWCKLSGLKKSLTYGGNMGGNRRDWARNLALSNSAAGATAVDEQTRTVFVTQVLRPYLTLARNLPLPPQLMRRLDHMRGPTAREFGARRRLQLIATGTHKQIAALSAHL